MIEPRIIRLLKYLFNKTPHKEMKSLEETRENRVKSQEEFSKRFKQKVKPKGQFEVLRLAIADYDLNGDLIVERPPFQNYPKIFFESNPAYENIEDMRVKQLFHIFNEINEALEELEDIKWDDQVANANYKDELDFPINERRWME